ncbi:vascular endothelial growth factor receptor 1-like [Planococcus citri]|uniref:vascular endothelial growth factor receptor 1-like n=1 Tax=Planococcus citri TaxID=170843 RepID=UPI0031F939D6
MPTFYCKILFLDAPKINLSESVAMLTINKSQNYDYKSNQKFQINCSVTGYPLPQVKWYQSNSDSLEHTYQEIPASDYNTTNYTSYYLISTLRFQSDGEKTIFCRATNEKGTREKFHRLPARNHSEGNTHFEYTIEVLIFICLLLTGIILYVMIRFCKEKMKLQKILEKYGLHECKENAVLTINPDLDIEQQTVRIPYNKKYEFPKRNLEFGEILGSGYFGIVKKAEARGIVAKDVKTTVAVKMAKDHNDSLSVKALASELKIMIYLGQHINVVNLLGACTKDLIKGQFYEVFYCEDENLEHRSGELAVIVEYCQYGNLREILLKHRNNFANKINGNDEIDISIATANW